MPLADIIVGALLFFAFGFAIYKMLKGNKKSSCGCSGCPSYKNCNKHKQ
ncbi:MAG: FeoB-associated Cys-rich membrane protein [Clostridiales bacterium]|nr:FeoB-associated Cys-rich membrane protein [Clostridiales bacterium]